ncbi:MAG: prephenate dehydrogenase/arogenate dehydrogenase family protein [Pelosinus sp.]|nr:prephenate dehydrogenase/arogenate dehydrogenase family protein [Pelosinus sp.]
MRQQRITIIGLGLIGGSLGLALKAAFKDEILITGFDKEETSMRQAVACGAIDKFSLDLAQVVSTAEVVYLCTPVLQIEPMVKQILPFLKQGTIITDVGSTKRYIGEMLEKLLPEGITYIGGHPMTGREQSGILAADKALFRNKWYIVILNKKVSEQAIDEVCRLAKATGAMVTVMDAVIHDRCAAVISHVPHVTAAAMVNLLELYPEKEESLKLAAGGFRDTTRIASSNADMWADICMTNPEAIADSLRNLQGLLSEMIEAMEHGDRQFIHDFFAAAKNKRDRLLPAVTN